MLLPKWLTELNTLIPPTTQDMEQDEAYISHVPLSIWEEDIHKEGLGPGSWEEGRWPHQTEAAGETMPLGLMLIWEMTSCMVPYSGDSWWKYVLLMLGPT